MLAAVLPALGCRCGRTDEQGAEATERPEVDAPLPEGPERILPSTGAVVWGPESLSSASRMADGLSAARGEGQAALVWIEQKDPGADVVMALLEPDGSSRKVGVTRGASSFAPTAVAWKDGGYTLAWGDDRYRHIEIFAARVSARAKVSLAPRRLTVTTPSDASSGGVFSADSSQTPTLVPYGDRLLAAWGGPGEKGRQQVYVTALATSGKPRLTPRTLTSGSTDAHSLSLAPVGEGAVLSYCVRTPAGSDMFLLPLAGMPPEPGAPVEVGTSAYVPCTLALATFGQRGVVFWAHREVEEGVIEDGIAVRAIDADARFLAQARDVEGVNLMRFAGKHRAAFDVLGLDADRVALAWIQRDVQGRTSLRLALLAPSGELLTEPLVVETLFAPTDPHVVGSGRPGELLIAWMDREEGRRNLEVRAAHVRLSQ